MKTSLCEDTRQDLCATFPNSHSAESISAEIKRTSWMRMMQDREVGRVQARWALIWAYESGFIDATAAFYHMNANDLLGDDDELLQVYIAGIRAISAMVLPVDDEGQSHE